MPPPKGIQNNPLMNFYDTLNVAPKATIEEIEQAYRQLAHMAHPDFHQGQAAESEDRMQVLNLIRDTLTDPERRARYDAELAESGAIAETASHDAIRSNPKRALTWSSKQWALVIVAGILLGMILGGSFWLHGWRSAPSSSPLTDPPASSPPSPLTPSALESSPATAPLVKPAVTPPKRPPQVVQQGSSLNEILQMMGDPDRVEEDSSHSLRILYYGKLRLILRNGRLVQGQTVP